MMQGTGGTVSIDGEKVGDIQSWTLDEQKPAAVPTREVWVPSSDTLAVVTHFVRPDKAAACLDRLSYEPCDVLLVDQSPAAGVAVAPLLEKSYDDRWSSTINLGPPSRFYPALALAQHYRYILFIDDDVQWKGPLVRSFCREAKSMGDRFATLGLWGRHYTDKGNGELCYNRHKVRPYITIPRQVDLTGRLHFVRADKLWGVARLVARLAGRVTARWLWEDDILLSEAMKLATGQGSWLLPGNSGPRLTGGRCDDPMGHSARPDFVDVRGKLVSIIRELEPKAWE